MRIRTANGGVAVRMDHRAPTEPHAFGTVVEAGGGVPWVVPGDRVIYPIAAASEVWVDVDAYAHVPSRSCEGGASTPRPEAVPIHVIDQREIVATVDESGGVRVPAYHR